LVPTSLNDPSDAESEDVMDVWEIKDNKNNVVDDNNKYDNEDEVRVILGNDFQDDINIDIQFPSATETRLSWKETNAFQTVGPFMKEYLDLLELTCEQESKIQSLVTVVGVNNNKKLTHVSCQK
jgi:hypothetical protein